MTMCSNGRQPCWWSAEPPATADSYQAFSGLRSRVPTISGTHRVTSERVSVGSVEATIDLVGQAACGKIVIQSAPRTLSQTSASVFCRHRALYSLYGVTRSLQCLGIEDASLSIASSLGTTPALYAYLWQMGSVPYALRIDHTSRPVVKEVLRPSVCKLQANAYGTL